MTTTDIPVRHEFASLTAPGRVFYVCGSCFTVSRESQEDRPCPVCFCHLCHERPRLRSGYPCAECQTRLNAEGNERERAELLAREVVEDDGSPVYFPACDRYFESSYEAAEYVYDQGVDVGFLAASAIPCDKVPAHTPDLVGVVQEAWDEPFDGDYINEMDATVERALTDMQKLIEKHAPTMWVPRKGVRINLPVVASIAGGTHEGGPR